MDKKKQWKVGTWVSIVALCFVGCTFSLGTQMQAYEERVLSVGNVEKVLLLEINGVIGSGELPDLSNRETVPLEAQLKEQLILAEQDPSIRAVVLKINSPGGEVTLTDILHHELSEFRKRSQIPLVASISSVGASGGYYIALAADEIVLHPTGIVGSIGVMMMLFNAEGLLEKIGVQSNFITSGELKTIGSPLKKMTPKEKKILQEILDYQYEQFLQIVARGRNLSMEQVKPLADGRIYSSPQAKENQLVDQIGYLQDAINVAATKAGITNPTIIKYQRGGTYSNNIYAQFPNSPTEVHLLHIDLPSVHQYGSPTFWYLWSP